MTLRNVQFDFSDRVALVTASSRGLGLAIARELLASGARVTICGRDPTSLREAEAALRDIDPDRVHALSGDLADASFASSLVPSTAEAFGEIVDTLVTNSGGPPPGLIEELDDSRWHDAIDGVLMSTVRLIRSALPGMKEKGFGRILCLTSTTAKEPVPGMVLSSATRAAVVSMAKTLSREAGPAGVTVNSILTGGVRTDRFEQLVRRSIEGSSEPFEEALDRLRADVPVRYFADPEEFARATLLLATREAGYINGSAFAVDGGILRSLF